MRLIVFWLTLTVFFLMPSLQEGTVEKDGTVVIGKSEKIFSKILGEERPLLVYLPETYDQSQNRYPVLYLLDGDYHFHHVTGIVQFLSREYEIPAMILVAISNLNRNRDFLPTKVNDIPPVTASDKFMTFMKDELIPYVDKKYRTSPYRILCGHSFAGLFSIYFFLNDPEFFQAIIAVSPSIYWDNRLVFRKVERLFKEHPGLKKILFYTAAGEDKEEIRSACEDFSLLLKDKAPKALEWHFRFMEKETHGSGVHRSVYNGLETIFSGWRIPGKQLEKMSLEEIRQHYKKLSAKHGCEIRVPWYVIIYKGFGLLREKKYDAAIEVFKFCAAIYPNRSRVYNFLFYAYESAGKLELAKKALEIAIQLAENNKDKWLPQLKKALTDLSNKMKAKKQDQ